MNDGGTPNDPTDDTIDFTPDPEFDGNPTINYTITDSDGDTSSATVDIRVTQGQVPTAEDDTATVAEDSGTTNIPVLSNDNFGGDGPSTGTITLDGVTGGTATVNDGGTPNDPTDDTIDFTPDADFNGAATINYTITDSDGDTSSATVDVTVTPVNDVPTAEDDTATVLEDSGVNNITVLGNDNFGGDGPSTGTITVDGATNGTATVNDGGTPNDPTDDTIDFTPDADFNGAASINYTITDSNGDTSSAIVDITVEAEPNQPPVANNDNSTTLSGQPVTFNISDNDNDIDGTIDPNTIDIDPNTPGNQNTITVPEGTFTVDNNGNLTFTPEPG
ncbi:MAG: tandem-95 repeat protein, partial [Okeania sp. SIO2F4]|nr:tandem-95 repeat protein [Okeania sp. SIO2F4]